MSPRPRALPLGVTLGRGHAWHCVTRPWGPPWLWQRRGPRARASVPAVPRQPMGGTAGMAAARLALPGCPHRVPIVSPRQHCPAALGFTSGPIYNRGPRRRATLTRRGQLRSVSPALCGSPPRRCHRRRCRGAAVRRVGGGGGAAVPGAAIVSAVPHVLITENGLISARRPAAQRGAARGRGRVRSVPTAVPAR